MEWILVDIRLNEQGHNVFILHQILAALGFDVLRDEATEGKAGETVIVPPTNERYIKLFAKYNKETKTMSEWIAEKWKKIKGITVSTD